MSYEVFQKKVNALIKRAGGGISAGFSHDAETGRHFAKCSDGTVIVGNESCLKVSVHWNGCNHQAFATI